MRHFLLQISAFFSIFYFSKKGGLPCIYSPCCRSVGQKTRRMRHFLYQCMLFKVGSKFLQESNISFRYHCIDATLPVPITAIMTVKKIECLSNNDTKFRQVLEAYIFYNLTSKFLPKNMQKK